MTTRQRNLVNKYLSKRDKKRLQEEFSLSDEAVRLKLIGDRNSEEEFILRAINLAETRKKMREQVKSKLKKLAA